MAIFCRLGYRPGTTDLCWSYWEGEKLALPDCGEIDLFADTQEDMDGNIWWVATEGRTGAKLAEGESRADLIVNCVDMLSRGGGQEGLKKGIALGVAHHGQSPIYDEG